MVWTVSPQNVQTLKLEMPVRVENSRINKHLSDLNYNIFASIIILLKPSSYPQQND